MAEFPRNKVDLFLLRHIQGYMKVRFKAATGAERGVFKQTQGHCLPAGLLARRIPLRQAGRSVALTRSVATPRLTEEFRRAASRATFHLCQQPKRTAVLAQLGAKYSWNKEGLFRLLHMQGFMFGRFKAASGAERGVFKQAWGSGLPA